MKVLIDGAHPADVWVLGAVEKRLLDAGAETLWISRPGKDNVVELIETRVRPHVRGPQTGSNRLSLARELLIRDQVTLRTVRKFRPDVILTRSPAGVHAGWLTRTPVLYDTDDGHAVGLLFYCDTWVGRLPYREELQHRWGLTKTFNPNHDRAFFAELERVLHNRDAERAAQQQRRQKMLEWCADPVDYVASWVYELAAI